ncbi:MAG TPA: glycoside hydrolase family 127 protein [Lacunisphaera sp.]|nr:glycoside hydrolase family 127 protein [Lacunisphaera sp.]
MSRPGDKRRPYIVGHVWLWRLLALAGLAATAPARAAEPPLAVAPDTPAKIYRLDAVRLLDGGPFPAAVKANREYLLALEPDRLLAPFRREAGLPAKAQAYGNWESIGLDGHTAGHYLSALADMIASGADTPDGELRRRLDYMVGELQACQAAWGNGYVGGVPGSKALWAAVAGGDVRAVNKKWVPWYNLHKTFAGLRDAYLQVGNTQARDVLIHLGNWCVDLTSKLSDEQMQRMLDQEHGGMDEVMADIFAITGDRKYLVTAQRFIHHAVLDPLMAQQDQLTGKHANTQIPKVAGLERIATLTGDAADETGARFFWQTVTAHRSVVFGGNSVSEHFNDPHNFHGMLVSREGPETCNTYNMLRLTEQLFAREPDAAYADYYERALFNHILASINPDHPGYVYFTPIRPDHYRVYSTPGVTFWCCVGTGMENPGKYGEFIYARARDGIYVNLFIASELTAPDLGLTLRQETAFPDEERSRFTLKLARPAAFTLHLRYPGWVAAGALRVRVNGQPVAVAAGPSSYVPVQREWHDGDRVEIDLPMRTTVEGLPDGSNWYAILHGPIVLAHPAGDRDLKGLRADDSRMGQVASGPAEPLDRAPVLLAAPQAIPASVVADPAAGPLHFKLERVVEPPAAGGLELIPFFRLHDARYQMYWETTTREGLAARQAALAAAERERAAREAATIDWVAPGEQQPEVEHGFQGEGTASGVYNGRRWRHGRWFQYTLDTHSEKAVTLSVTYSGDDSGRKFEILANGTLLAVQNLAGNRLGEFIDRTYEIPASVLAAAPGGRVTIKFAAAQGLAGGVYDVRLLRTSHQP